MYILFLNFVQMDEWLNCINEHVLLHIVYHVFFVVRTLNNLLTIFKNITNCYPKCKWLYNRCLALTFPV